ncbi:MAG: hypothetical protein HC803_07280 [Saprospiraceae bacterium]|nr:hypothetical protein [Saprospiraceae bacterium]
MQLKFLITCFLLGFGLTISAQITTSLDDNTTTRFTTVDESWVLFENQEDKTIFIDFESIESTVSDIRIKTESDEIQFSDVVSDLPQDTIYELDFSILPEGNYTIEIRTYQEVLTKKIKV